MKRDGGPTVRYPIPCGPLLEIVDAWIDASGGADGAAIRRLNDACGRTDVGKTLARMRSEQSHVGFDTADMLVCATWGPQLWHTNPGLKQAVEWLDRNSGPYCPGCWANVDGCECAAAA